MWLCDIRFTLDGDVDHNVTHLTEQRNRAQDRKQGMFNGDLTYPSKTLASLEFEERCRLGMRLSHSPGWFARARTRQQAEAASTAHT